MKFLLSIFLIFPLIVFGQNKGNSHFFKLLVQNDSQEILLINFDGSWEIPGSRYSDNSTIPVFLNTMAKDHGIEIEDSKLAALITFHHEVRDYPTMMFYYRTQYASGDLSTPSWGQDVKWFSIENACKVIPYKEMSYIIKSIVNQDSFVEGAFIIEYDKNTFKRTGEFRILNELKK